jgi:hypothetical protein
MNTASLANQKIIGGRIMTTIHKGPPPGFVTARQAAADLKMSPQTFYSHYADLLESWQVGGQATPRLYRESDLGLLRAWLTLREGLKALGLPQPPASSPDWRGVVDSGEHDAVCPVCGDDRAVTNYPEFDRIWCPVCGVVENSLDIGREIA